MKLIKLVKMCSLKMFNTGQMTLPKKWRSKFETSHFVAKETKDGLLIMPLIDEDFVAYENEKEAGIIFPGGVDPNVLIDQISKIDG